VRWLLGIGVVLSLGGCSSAAESASTVATEATVDPRAGQCEHIFDKVTPPISLVGGGATFTFDDEFADPALKGPGVLCDGTSWEAGMRLYWAAIDRDRRVIYFRESPNGIKSWQFDRLLEAQVIIEDWRIDYNDNRPHTAHGDLTPTEFAHAWTINQPEAA
jgi:Integrase core domain